MRAAFAGDFRDAASLLQRGASVNLRDRKGATALMNAAMQGECDIMEMLLQRRAELETGSSGTTALVVAAMESHSDAVALLLGWGADPDVRDEEHVAGRGRRPPCCWGPPIAWARS